MQKGYLLDAHLNVLSYMELVGHVNIQAEPLAVSNNMQCIRVLYRI